MILLWVFVAIVVGAFVGRVFGFMLAEFVLAPFFLVARGIATVLGWVSGWAKRLP